MLYLEDSERKTMEATVLAVSKESEGCWQVILDQTVFYPMGGGQRADQGTLEAGRWQGKVYQVLMKGDQVCHFVKAPFPPEVGLELTGSLNWQRRYKNMRLHSAGHLVDFAIYRLGYSPRTLTPIKADHGKKPCIYYTGTSDLTVEELESEANQLVQSDLTLSTRFVTYEELKEEAIYIQPGLPENKPLRILTLENVGSVADGGTQVKRSSEVGDIVINSIEKKDDTTVVYYTIGELS